MTPAFSRSILFGSLMAFACAVPSIRAQDSSAPMTAAKTDLPLRLDLSRRDLKNFLTDETALAPHRSSDGTALELNDIFTMGSVSAPYAIFWDPLSCRLLGILDLEASAEAGKPDAPSPYLYQASGPMPLTGTAGVSGNPRYFGFRLVEGKPEFLYTCGSLAVEERLWLEEGGLILRQRFSAKDAVRGLQITVPANWKGRVEASVGSWKGAVLTVPKDGSAEVVLTYSLAPALPIPETAKPDSN